MSGYITCVDDDADPRDSDETWLEDLLRVGGEDTARHVAEILGIDLDE